MYLGSMAEHESLEVPLRILDGPEEIELPGTGLWVTGNLAQMSLPNGKDRLGGGQ